MPDLLLIAPQSVQINIKSRSTHARPGCCRNTPSRLSKSKYRKQRAITWMPDESEWELEVPLYLEIVLIWLSIKAFWRTMRKIKTRRWRWTNRRPWFKTSTSLTNMRPLCSPRTSPCPYINRLSTNTTQYKRKHRPLTMLPRQRKWWLESDRSMQ